MTIPEETTSARGAPAGFGRRLVAFVVDGALAVLIALVTGHRPPSGDYNFVVYAAFLLIELAFVALAGQTPGMRAAGIAVVRFADGGRPALHWVFVRTVLLATVVVALITDSSGRALHDRAAGTTTLRLR